ncbi:hypothetical protein OKW96_03950 [Sphingobacterium sp. KU25419]|nr:hypothetical protein OKW96_03950 [Sphingobacterium sp. KU25419]
MTFEEFFAKKKIDLTALQKADNSLYEEFKKHYVAMGAKSFDHTKKFWFNKLRKSYHLAETPIDKKEVQQAIVKEQQSVKAEVTTTATGFKPRFKAPTITKDIIPEETETSNNRVEKTSESASDNDVAAKPAGFKPRFKAGVTKPAIEAQNNIPTEQQAEGQADKTVASIPTTETASTDLPTEGSSKPAGFKPRFKAGITKPATAAEDIIPTEQQAEGQADKTAASIPTTETAPADLPTEGSSKPAGFKPRFKAGITKQQKQTQYQLISKRKSKLIKRLHQFLQRKQPQQICRQKEAANLLDLNLVLKQESQNRQQKYRITYQLSSKRKGKLIKRLHQFRQRKQP